MTYARFFNFIAKTGLLAFTLLFVLISFSDQISSVEIEVSKRNGKADTVQQFEKAVIISPSKIHVQAPTTGLRLLSPREHLLNPFYSLILFLGAVVVIVFFWDFSYDNPFTIKALRGLKVAFGLLLLFMLVDFWRHYWLYEQVRLLTDNQYNYDEPTTFSSTSFWLLIIFLRLIWIFKKGTALQKETDLTV